MFFLSIALSYLVFKGDNRSVKKTVMLCCKDLQSSIIIHIDNFLTLKLNLNEALFLFQTHLTFGKEFTEAVEMKQVGE